MPRCRSTRHLLAAFALSGSVSALAGCGADDAAVEARRAQALQPPAADATDAPTPTEPAGTGPAGTDASGDPAGDDPQPGLTAAATALIAASPSSSGDTCPLFDDASEIMAPYGAVTSLSSGTETSTVAGAEVAELYCNIGTEGGLASFTLTVASVDAATVLDDQIAASPNLSSGTITPVEVAPSGALEGSFAGVCIEDAEVSDQCRYAWSSGDVNLVYADLSELDPATALGVLETAVAVMSLTIV